MGQDRKAIVLVIDDEPLIVRCTKQLLEYFGYSVITAGNGLEALQRLTEVSADVIVSDIRMPQMDGVKFIETLRGLGILTPVVFMTAYSDVSEERAIELGAKTVLAKPVAPESLLNVIEYSVPERLRATR